jgi:cell division septation protein DedD
MKFLLHISSLILLIILFTGCNSTLYDIVEIEEPVEIKPDIKTTENDIKSDKEENNTLTESTQPESTQPESTEPITTHGETSSESNRSESKFSDNEVISQKYDIQLGALNQISNLNSCTRTAQKN